jgi:hypothetical protein
MNGDSESIENTVDSHTRPIANLPRQNPAQKGAAAVERTSTVDQGQANANPVANGNMAEKGLRRTRKIPNRTAAQKAAQAIDNSNTDNQDKSDKGADDEEEASAPALKKLGRPAGFKSKKTLADEEDYQSGNDDVWDDGEAEKDDGLDDEVEDFTAHENKGLKAVCSPYSNGRYKADG